jgi:hypothetical protein
VDDQWQINAGEMKSLSNGKGHRVGSLSHITYIHTHTEKERESERERTLMPKGNF